MLLRRGVLLASYALSVILIADTLFCILWPSCYPTENLENIVPIRSLENHPPLPSSVEFTEAPVNTKQVIQVDLHSLDETKIEWTQEIYLTEDATLEYYDYRFLSFELVDDLRVYLNGRPLEYGVQEYEGAKYYTIPSFNLSGKGKINRLEYSFKLKRTVIPSKLARSPLLFNENFARLIQLPTTNIPMRSGHTSDLSTFRVTNYLPFRDILIAQSGWMDLYFPPRDEWTRYLVDSNTYNLPRFQYPISQECRRVESTYYFETRFLASNIASRLTIVVVPSPFKVPMLLLLFLSSPFYIPIFAWVRKGKGKTRTRKRKNKRQRIMQQLYTILELYSGPILSIMILLLGGEFNLSLLSSLIEVTHPIVLLFVLLYPALFFSVHKGI